MFLNDQWKVCIAAILLPSNACEYISVSISIDSICVFLLYPLNLFQYVFQMSNLTKLTVNDIKRRRRLKYWQRKFHSRWKIK